MTKRRSSSARNPLFSLGLLLLAVVLVYLPAINGPFIFDDFDSIPNNPTITRLWPLTVPLHPPAHEITVSGRPIVNLSLAVNHAINDALGVDQRPDPDGPHKTTSYHVVNLLLHLLCGLLLFGLVRRTLADVPGGLWTPERANAVALFATALWLLHPLETEAVDYLIQRTEIIVSACYIATLYASVRAWDATTDRSRTWWYIAGVVICASGMGSKEVMISAPLAVICYDRAFRLPDWKSVLRPGNGRGWFYVALALTAAILIGLIVSGPRSDTVGFHLGLSWYGYLYSQAWAILHYLRLLAWPNALSLDYRQDLITGLAGVPGLLVLTAAGIGVLWAWTRPARWGWLAFLGTLFFMILAPSSSFVPIKTEIVAERRMYLASAVVLVLVALGADRLERRFANAPSQRRALSFAKVGVLAVLAVTTAFRSHTYADSERIWADAIHKVPDDSRAYQGLGLVIVNKDESREGEAAALFQHAVALDSTSAPSYYQLGLYALHQHRVADARAFFQHAVANNPKLGIAQAHLGNVLLNDGDAAAAVPHLQLAVATDTSATALIDLGQAYQDLHRPDDAVTAYKSALAANPSLTDVRAYLGALLTDLGRPTEALPYLEEAARENPSAPLTEGLEAIAYAAAGRTPDAVTAANAAASAGSTDPRVYLFAGRAMLGAKRPADAVIYLQRALTLAPRSPEILTRLGDADAMDGRTVDAREMYSQALAIQPTFEAARQGLARLGGSHL